MDVNHINLELNPCNDYNHKQTLSIGKVSGDLNNTENKLLRREFRVAKTLAIVTIVFIICLLPFYTTLLVSVIRKTD